MHRRAVGERRQPDLRDIPARQAILDQRAHRIAVRQPACGLTHVEMGIERDQPDRVERHPETMDARPRHRIIAADQQGQRVRRDTGRNGLTDWPGRRLDRQPVKRDIAMIGDAAGQLASRVDVIASDPLQCRAQQRGRAVAPPRTDRAKAKRGSDQTDRRAKSFGRLRPDHQVRQIGPAARHRFDASTAPA